jgi:hypothetical protein
MSTLPAVTMQDLELEHAELLPSRETLNCCRHHGGGGGFSFTQVAAGQGNTNQAGIGNISALNGNNVLVVV